MSKLSYGQVLELEMKKRIDAIEVGQDAHLWHGSGRPRIKLTAHQLSRFPKRRNTPSHGYLGKAYHRPDGALVIALPHEHDPKNWLTWTAFDVVLVAHPAPSRLAMPGRALGALLVYHHRWPASAPFGRHSFVSEWLAGSRATRARARQRQRRRTRRDKRGW